MAALIDLNNSYDQKVIEVDLKILEVIGQE